MWHRFLSPRRAPACGFACRCATRLDVLMQIGTLLIVGAAGASASTARMSSCDGHASFTIVADGGGNFEAHVNVARWQTGKRIELDFGANQVKIRPGSVSGGAALLPGNNPVFRLDEKKRAGREANPPGTISFRADGPPVRPSITCDLAASLAAFPPMPPPSPPRCAASLMWKNGRRWTGGFEAFIEVGNTGVPPGFAVRVDLRGQTGLELLAADGASLISLDGTVLLLRPTRVNAKSTITIRMRGNGGGSPQVLCIPAPPAPPPPPMACALGPSWEVTETVKEGKRYVATVGLAQWRAGTLLTLDLGSGQNVVSVSSASRCMQPLHARHARARARAWVGEHAVNRV